MINIILDLPPKYRLQLKFAKRRKSLDATPLLPNLGSVFRAKSGNKLSRYFRHIFQHNRIKRVFGANLAFLTITSSLLVPQISPTVNASQLSETDSFVAQAPIVLTTNQTIRYPVKDIKITQGYSFIHPGIDLDGQTGDQIQPLMEGFVEGVEYSRFGYGNSIIIGHFNGFKTLYAHLSKVYVKVGDEVSTTTSIGEMGATGRAFGDHLHLEVYKDGKTINPLTILPAN